MDRAHDALADAKSLRRLFFADNLAGAFFRAELHRLMRKAPGPAGNSAAADSAAGRSSVATIDVIAE